jgi:diadenosine tetraphosphate (Ap4A) HIT family hydrolase
VVGCPFCAFAEAGMLRHTPHAFAMLDAYPVSKGHCLIIPRRHVASWFDATADERNEMFDLLRQVREYLCDAYAPEGYNVGINDGAAAGQTVPHLHLHLIPRYAGDRPDPRGGVRWVIPERADYWSDRR